MKETVDTLLSRMETAAEIDLDHNRQGKPAVQKLQLLPQLESLRAQPDLHREFMASGGLGVLKAWLELMPNGSLPNSQVCLAVAVLPLF